MNRMFVLALLGACTVIQHPTALATLPPSAARGFDAVLAGTPVDHEQVISARWAVPRKGLVDLGDPLAAHLGKDKVPIVLPVHVLNHPTQGTFIIDTGISRDREQGGDGAARGVVRGFLADVQSLESLGHILDRQPGPLSGVLLTHSHLDHVLGLPDVPLNTPIYTGLGELSATHFMAPLMRPTYNALFADRPPVLELDPADAVSLGPVQGIDLLGDGSIWAIPSPGHTSGSLAFLVRTHDGLSLFVGDTSHTRWGWDNGVTPGTYTADHDNNARSLASLKALVALHPEIEVFVGHE